MKLIKIQRKQNILFLLFLLILLVNPTFKFKFCAQLLLDSIMIKVVLCFRSCLTI